MSQWGPQGPSQSGESRGPPVEFTSRPGAPDVVGRPEFPTDNAPLRAEPHPGLSARLAANPKITPTLQAALDGLSASGDGGEKAQRMRNLLARKSR